MVRFLEKFDIDFVQLKALSQASLKLDFRRPVTAMSRGRKPRSAFWYTLISYLFISLAIAAGVFKITDVPAYSFVILTVSMVMMAMAVIIEFHEIILNPLDADILGSRPVSSRTFFVSRVANLFFYVTVMGFALTLVPAVMGIWVKGSSWAFALVFLLTSWLANLNVAAYMILFYTLLVKLVNYDRLKDILAYVQMALTFILVLGYQFIPHLSEKTEAGHLIFRFEHLWNFLVPPAWFAGLTSVFFSTKDFWMLSLGTLAVVSTAIFLLIAFRNISLEYAGYLQKMSEKAQRFEKVIQEKSRPRKATGGRKFRWIRPGEEEVGYELTAKYLRRDRTLRTRIFPSFGIPLAMLAFFLWEGSLSDPFYNVKGYGAIFPLVFLVYVVFFFYEIISTSENWKGSWIFWSAPIRKPSGLFWGAAKLFLLRYMVPFFVLVWLILLLKMPPLHAFWVTFFNFVVSLVYFMFLALFNTKYPLSRPFERGQSNMRFLITVLFVPVFVVAAGLEYVVFRFPRYFFPGLVILLLVLFVLWKWADYLMDLRLTKLEYHG